MTEQVEADIDRAVEALATLRGKEIRYADIRKGDRICVVTVDRWGGSVTDIDVVTHLSEDGWESESGLTLVGEGGSDRRTFLLHRPAPSLPAEEGATILVTRYKEYRPHSLLVLMGGVWVSASGDVSDPRYWTSWVPVTLGEVVTTEGASA